MCYVHCNKVSSVVAGRAAWDGCCWGVGYGVAYASYALNPHISTIKLLVLNCVVAAACWIAVQCGVGLCVLFQQCSRTQLAFVQGVEFSASPACAVQSASAFLGTVAAGVVLDEGVLADDVLQQLAHNVSCLSTAPVPQHGQRL
jgi:hypothetical protein